MSEYWSGYNKEPVGGGNPYYACVGCGRTEPEINGSIERHGDNCSEVQKYKLRQFVIDHGGDPEEFGLI